jgi:hypothetical protein
MRLAWSLIRISTAVRRAEHPRLPPSILAASVLSITAATFDVLSLVLEFLIGFVLPPTGERRILVHLRDVIALRCTNRRPLGDIEIRTDLFLARSGRGYWCAQRRFAENQGRYYMGFLRAIVADFVNAPVMRSPPLVLEFRETDDHAQEAEEEARERILSAQRRGYIVDTENDEDLESEEDADDDSDDDSVVVWEDASVSTGSTHAPWIGDGVESFDTLASTETDIANLADLEGCIDDADAA